MKFHRRQAMNGLLASTLIVPFGATAQAPQAQYLLLARFQIDHQYFNGGDKGAGSFVIVPTAQTAQFMQYAGLVARFRGAGVDIYVASDAYDRLRAGYTDYEAWLNSDAMNSLVFEVRGNDPLLFIATAPQPGFTREEEFWLRSDWLTDAIGTLQIIGAPRTGDDRSTKIRLGHFELRFAAPGGPIAGLFSQAFPPIEARTYTLRLASRVVRRRYHFVPQERSNIDGGSLRIVDRSGSVLGASLAETTIAGKQAISVSLERQESLRKYETDRLTLWYKAGSSSENLDLPGPSPESVKPDDGENAIADIYVYM